MARHTREKTRLDKRSTSQEHCTDDKERKRGVVAHGLIPHRARLGSGRTTYFCVAVCAEKVDTWVSPDSWLNDFFSRGFLGPIIRSGEVVSRQTGMGLDKIMPVVMKCRFSG